MEQFKAGMIQRRIKVARGHRNTVKEVQSSVGQLAVSIGSASKKDLAPECRKIQDRLRREIGFGFSDEEGVIGQLAQALGTLHDALAALKEQGKPPSIAETDPQGLPKAVDQGRPCRPCRL